MQSLTPPPKVPQSLEKEKVHRLQADLGILSYGRGTAL